MLRTADSSVSSHAYCLIADTTSSLVITFNKRLCAGIGTRRHSTQLPFPAVQMHPPSQQQPSLSLHQTAHPPALAKKFRPPDFIDRPVGVLHHMELVKHNAALRRPSENALRERLPHVHAGRHDPASLH